MRTSRLALRPGLLAALLLLSGPGNLLAGSQSSAPTYLDYKPLAIATAGSLESLLQTVKAGQLSLGEQGDRQSAPSLLARVLYLPSLDGVDTGRPASLYYLTTDPPTALPLPACLIPVKPGKGPELAAAFARSYGEVSGGGLRCYTSPITTNLPPALYVAIVENRALLSPHLESLRWLALKCRDGTIPTASRFRDVPLHLTIDASLAGSYCKILGTLLPSAKGRRAFTMGGYTPFLREGAVFFPQFTTLDLALGADTVHWHLSARLTYPPAGSFARSIGTIGPPGQDWRKVFPLASANRSASALPAFVRSLPTSNRRLLSDLAAQSQLFGFHLLPSAPDADDRLFPTLAGHGAFAFISDSSSKFVGSIALYDLVSPEPARFALQSYFGDAGGVGRNPRIASHGTRQSRGHEVFVYDLLPPESKGQTPLEQSALVIASLLEMNHVEVAVADGRLIVGRGRHGLVDRWIADMDQSGGQIPSPDRLPRPFDGESSLGGGVLEPTKVASGAFAFLPDFPDISSRLPPPGGGFPWRMTRSPRGLTFDFSFSSNELIPCLALGALNNEYKDDLLTRFLMQRFGEDKPGQAR